MNIEQIDTSTTAGKLRVMELAEQGRKVVYRVRRADSHVWHDHTKWGEPDWDWGNIDYAIIAEPVGPDEVYLEIMDNGDIEGSCRRKDHAGSFLGRCVRYIRADIAGENG